MSYFPLVTSRQTREEIAHHIRSVQHQALSQNRLSLLFYMDIVNNYHYTLEYEADLSCIVCDPQVYKS